MTVCIFPVFNNMGNAEASSQAEIAMELETESVLTDKNADVKLPMASTTKILTAIIIIEDCNLDEVIKVDEKAVGVEGSSIYLKRDEEIDVRDLLYGLMLRSGNDSAAALAIHHSGSIDAFVQVMNERASKIGAVSTKLDNPSGLPSENHYTTARDLCLISCYAMKNPTFKQVVSTKNYNGKFRSFVNKNKMLKEYSGANGVKTGYTVKAGRCLVSSAERDGMDVVCVVLNCPDMYERSSAILDYCFKTYELYKIDKEKIFLCGCIPCKLSSDAVFVNKKAQDFNFFINKLKNDVEKGAVAELTVYSQNRLIFKSKLYNI